MNACRHAGTTKSLLEIHGDNIQQGIKKNGKIGKNTSHGLALLTPPPQPSSLKGQSRELVADINTKVLNFIAVLYKYAVFCFFIITDWLNQIFPKNTTEAFLTGQSTFCFNNQLTCGICHSHVIIANPAKLVHISHAHPISLHTFKMGIYGSFFFN